MHGDDFKDNTVEPMRFAVSVQTTARLQRTFYKLIKSRTYSYINGGDYAPMVSTTLYTTNVSQESSKGSTRCLCTQKDSAKACTQKDLSKAAVVAKAFAA